MAKIVTATWTDPSPTTYVDHLEVWRKTGSSGTYAKISGNITLGTETYVDNSTLTDGETYYYNVRAYNSSGGFSSIEANITISSATILFEDDFSQATVPDTANKWDKTNPSSEVVFGEGTDELKITNTYVSGSGYLEDYIVSKPAFTVGSVTCLIFDIQRTPTGFWYTGLTKTDGLGDDTIRMFWHSSGAANDIDIYVKHGGTVEHSDTTKSLDITTEKTIKYLMNGTAFSISYWNGSGWTVIDSATVTAISGDWKVLFAGRSAAALDNEILIDNVTVTDTDILTQYPS